MCNLIAKYRLHTPTTVNRLVQRIEQGKEYTITTQQAAKLLEYIDGRFEMFGMPLNGTGCVLEDVTKNKALRQEFIDIVLETETAANLAELMYHI